MTAPYRVLVTGSRGWPHVDAVHTALATLERLRESQPMLLVHGACPRSPDTIADRWVKHSRAAWPGTGSAWLEPEVHEADWLRYGVRSGFVRNAEMVALGADVCLAFIGRCTTARCRDNSVHDSHGASHCADLAERVGITTVRYRVAELDRVGDLLPERLRRG